MLPNSAPSQQAGTKNTTGDNIGEPPEVEALLEGDFADSENIEFPETERRPVQSPITKNDGGGSQASSPKKSKRRKQLEDQNTQWLGDKVSVCLHRWVGTHKLLTTTRL